MQLSRTYKAVLFSPCICPGFLLALLSSIGSAHREKPFLRENGSICISFFFFFSFFTERKCLSRALAYFNIRL